MKKFRLRKQRKLKTTFAGSMAAYLRTALPDPVKPKKRKKRKYSATERARLAREQALGSQRSIPTKKQRRQMATESRRRNRCQ